MTPEGKVKDAIKKVLKVYGVWYFMPQPGPYQKSGIPDFLGILPWSGQFLGIEAKGPGGKPTENQKRICAEINANGGVAIITDNVDDVRDLLHDCQQKAQEVNHRGQAPTADNNGHTDR
jgi:hypothetical protein